ncbi:Sugar transporter STL1 [Spathaspora sp. JA1]|nr:Sugar transporter STL1 [Spathaspora sp. JA1]
MTDNNEKASTSQDSITSSGDNEHEFANDSTTYSYLGLKGKTLHHAVSVFAGMGFLLFGYDQGVMGSLLTLPTFRETFPSIDTTRYPDRATFQGFVIAIYEIGCLAGAIFTMYIGDKIGRRKTIFIGCIIMVIGAVIQAASYTVVQLIAGRIVTGIGNGMNTATVPVWQSECAKAKDRGRLVMVQGALITGGICFSYWVDFGFFFIKGSSVSWRFPIAFQIIFPVFILPVILKLPESPRWLLKAGNIQEAARVFSALDNLPVNDPTIIYEVNDIVESLEKERQDGTDKSQFGLLFVQGETKNFHRACLAVWSQIMQQISGINLVVYYAGIIFENFIGLSPINSRIMAAANGTEFFLASWIAYYTIESFGRRKLMLFGAAGQAFSMAVLTGTTWAASPKNHNNGTCAIVAAVFLFVYNTFFAIGWLGMTWLYPAEITPLNIRAASNGLSTAGNWSFNFMVVMITPIAFESIDYYTYTIFAVINMLMVPTVYFFYPETAGRSLEEMDKIFELSNTSTPWDVVKIARELPFESQTREHDIEKLNMSADNKENTSSQGSVSSSGNNQLEYLDDSTIYTYLGLKGKKLHHAISIFAGMGFLLFGYDQGVMGSLLTLPTFRDTFESIDTTRYPDRATFQGFVIAIYEIGCLVGALSTMLFGDKIGRRKTIFTGCIIMIIGAIIQTSSFSVGQLIVGRIVTGLGNGMNTATVPMWQSECAKSKDRGRLVMIQGALITGGICISYWIDFGFFFIKNSSVSWRFPIAFQIIFPLFILPVILKLPESPRWLLKTGNVEEAARVFSSVDDVPVNDPTIIYEVNEIVESLDKERNDATNKSKFRLLFIQGETKNFHRTCLAVWSQIMQQISGINLVVYYAGVIFENYIGLSPLNSRILAAVNGTEFFLASWVAFYTIERFGRRKLMLFGAAGQAASMAILTGTTWAASPKNTDNTSAGIAAAVFLFVFNTFFGIGWLGMTWLYPAEITPLNIRAASNGLSTAANWSFNFMVVMITPVAFENIDYYTYTIFAVINLLMVPTVYFFYPETAGRSLEEMDKVFELSNTSTPWDVVKIARELPYEGQTREHDVEKISVEQI